MRRSSPTRQSAVTKPQGDLRRQGPDPATRARESAALQHVAESLLANGDMVEGIEQLFRIACSHGPPLEAKILIRQYFRDFCNKLGLTTSTNFEKFQQFGTIVLTETRPRAGDIPEKVTQEIELLRVGAESLDFLFDFAVDHSLVTDRTIEVNLLPPGMGRQVSQKTAAIVSPDKVAKTKRQQAKQGTSDSLALLEGCDINGFVAALMELVRHMVPPKQMPSFTQTNLCMSLFSMLFLKRNSFGQRLCREQTVGAIDDFDMPVAVCDALLEDCVSDLILDSFLFCSDPENFWQLSLVQRKVAYKSAILGELHIEFDNINVFFEHIDFKFALQNSELAYGLFQRYDTKHSHDAATMDFTGFRLMIAHLAMSCYFTNSAALPTPQAKVFQFFEEFLAVKMPIRHTASVIVDEHPPGTIVLNELKPARVTAGTEVWLFGNHFAVPDSQMGNRCPIYVKIGDEIVVGRCMSSTVGSFAIPHLTQNEETVVDARVDNGDVQGTLKISVLNSSVNAVYVSTDRMYWTRSSSATVTFEEKAAEFILETDTVEVLLSIFDTFAPKQEDYEDPQTGEWITGKQYMFLSDWSSVCQRLPELGIYDDGDVSGMIHRHPKFFEVAKPRAESKSPHLPCLTFNEMVNLLFRIYLQKYGASSQTPLKLREAVTNAEPGVRRKRGMGRRDEFAGSGYGSGLLSTTRRTQDVPATCANCGQDPSVKVLENPFLDLQVEAADEKTSQQTQQTPISVFSKALNTFSTGLPSSDVVDNMTEQEWGKLSVDQAAKLPLRGQFMFLQNVMNRVLDYADSEKKLEKQRGELTVEKVKASGKFLTGQVLKLQQTLEGVNEAMSRVLGAIQETEQYCHEERKLRLQGSIAASETLWVMVSQMFDTIRKGITNTKEITLPFVSGGTEPEKTDNTDFSVENALSEAQAFKDKIIAQATAMESLMRKKVENAMKSGAQPLPAKNTRRQSFSRKSSATGSDHSGRFTCNKCGSNDIQQSDDGNEAIPSTDANPETQPVAAAEPTEQTTTEAEKAPEVADEEKIPTIDPEKLKQELEKQRAELEISWGFKMKDLEKRKENTVKEATHILTEVVRVTQEEMKGLPDIIAGPAFRFLHGRGVQLDRRERYADSDEEDNFRAKFKPQGPPMETIGLQCGDDDLPAQKAMLGELVTRGLTNASKLSTPAVFLRRGMFMCRDVLGKFMSNAGLFEDFTKLLKNELQNVLNPRQRELVQLPTQFDEGMFLRDSTTLTNLTADDYLVARDEIEAMIQNSTSSAPKAASKPSKKGAKKPGGKEPDPALVAAKDSLIQKKAALIGEDKVAAMQDYQDRCVHIQTDDVEVRTRQNTPAGPTAEERAKELQAMLADFNAGQNEDNLDANEAQAQWFATHPSVGCQASCTTTTRRSQTDVTGEIRMVLQSSLNLSNLPVSTPGSPTTADGNNDEPTPRSTSEAEEPESPTVLEPPPFTAASKPAPSELSTKSTQTTEQVAPSSPLLPTPATSTSTIPKPTSNASVQVEILTGKEVFFEESSTAESPSPPESPKERELFDQETSVTPPPGLETATKTQQFPSNVPSASTSRQSSAPPVQQLSTSPSTRSEVQPPNKTDSETDDTEEHISQIASHVESRISTAHNNGTKSTTPIPTPPLESVPQTPGEKQPTPTLSTPLDESNRKSASNPAKSHTPTPVPDHLTPLPTHQKTPTPTPTPKPRRVMLFEEKRVYVPPELDVLPYAPSRSTSAPPPVEQTKTSAEQRQTPIPSSALLSRTDSGMSLQSPRQLVKQGSVTPVMEPIKKVPSSGFKEFMLQRQQSGTPPSLAEQGVPPQSKSPVPVPEKGKSVTPIVTPPASKPTSKSATPPTASVVVPAPIERVVERTVIQYVDRPMPKTVSIGVQVSIRTTPPPAPFVTVAGAELHPTAVGAQAASGAVLQPAPRPITDEKVATVLTTASAFATNAAPFECPPPRKEEQWTSMSANLLKAPNSAVISSTISEVASSMVASGTPDTAGRGNESQHHLDDEQLDHHHRLATGDVEEDEEDLDDVDVVDDALLDADALEEGWGPDGRTMTAPLSPGEALALITGDWQALTGIVPSSADPGSPGLTPMHPGHSPMGPAGHSPDAPPQQLLSPTKEQMKSVVAKAAHEKILLERAQQQLKEQQLQLLEQQKLAATESQEKLREQEEALRMKQEQLEKAAKLQQQQALALFHQQQQLQLQEQQQLQLVAAQRAAQQRKLAELHKAEELANEQREMLPMPLRDTTLTTQAETPLVSIIPPASREHLLKKRSEAACASKADASSAHADSPCTSPRPAPSPQDVVPSPDKRRQRQKSKPKQDASSVLWAGGFSVPQSAVLRSAASTRGGAWDANDSTSVRPSGDHSLVSTPGGVAPGGIGEFLQRMNEKLKQIESNQTSKEGPLRDENARLRFALGEVAAKASSLEVQLQIMRKASPEPNRSRKHSVVPEAELHEARVVLGERDVMMKKALRLLKRHAPGEIDFLMNPSSKSGLLEIISMVERVLQRTAQRVSGGRSSDSLAGACRIIVGDYFPDEVTDTFEIDEVTPIASLVRRLRDHLEAVGRGAEIPEDITPPTLVMTIAERLQGCTTEILQRVDEYLNTLEEDHTAKQQKRLAGGPFDENTDWIDDYSARLAKESTSETRRRRLASLDFCEHIFPVDEAVKQARKQPIFVASRQSGVPGSPKAVAYSTDEPPVTFPVACQTTSTGDGVSRGVQCDPDLKYVPPGFLLKIKPSKSIEVQTEGEIILGANAESILVFESSSQKLQGVSVAVQAVPFHSPHLADVDRKSMATKTIETQTTMANDNEMKRFRTSWPWKPQIARLFALARDVQQSEDLVLEWLFGIYTALKARDVPCLQVLNRQLLALQQRTTHFSTEGEKNKGRSEIGFALAAMMERGIEVINNMLSNPLGNTLTEHHQTVQGNVVVSSNEVHVSEFNFVIQQLLHRIDTRFAILPPEVAKSQRAINRFHHIVIDTLVKQANARVGGAAWTNAEEATVERLMQFDKLTGAQQRRLSVLQVIAIASVMNTYITSTSYVPLAYSIDAAPEETVSEEKPTSNFFLTGESQSKEKSSLSLSSTSAAANNLARLAVIQKVLPKFVVSELSSVFQIRPYEAVLQDSTEAGLLRKVWPKLLSKETLEFITSILAFNIGTFGWLAMQEQKQILQDEEVAQKKRQGLFVPKVACSLTPAMAANLASFREQIAYLSKLQPCEDLTFVRWVAAVQEVLHRLLGSLRTPLHELLQKPDRILPEVSFVEVEDSKKPEPKIDEASLRKTLSMSTVDLDKQRNVDYLKAMVWQPQETTKGGFPLFRRQIELPEDEDRLTEPDPSLLANNLRTELRIGHQHHGIAQADRLAASSDFGGSRGIAILGRGFNVSSATPPPVSSKVLSEAAARQSLTVTTPPLQRMPRDLSPLTQPPVTQLAFQGPEAVPVSGGVGGAMPKRGALPAGAARQVFNRRQLQPIDDSNQHRMKLAGATNNVHPAGPPVLQNTSKGTELQNVLQGGGGTLRTLLSCQGHLLSSIPASTLGLPAQEQVELRQLRTACISREPMDALDSRSMRRWVDLEIRAHLAEVRVQGGLEESPTVDEAVTDVMQCLYTVLGPAGINRANGGGYYDPDVPQQLRDPAAAIGKLNNAELREFIRLLRKEAGGNVGARLPPLSRIDC